MDSEAKPTTTAVMTHCPRCTTSHDPGELCCAACGFVHPDPPAPVSSLSDLRLDPPSIHGRYRLLDLISEFEGISRFRALDLTGEPNPIAVVVGRQALPPEAEFSDETNADDTAIAAGSVFGSLSQWPGLEWERWTLDGLKHCSIPQILDAFEEDGFAYLVVQSPDGVPLRDAWDDRSASARERYGWLAQLADALAILIDRGAFFQALRPEMLVLTPDGDCVIRDLSELVPIPSPVSAVVRQTPYTPPEFVLNPAKAEPRSGLYSLGAILYSLVIGRELNEMDFTLSGVPRPLLDRLPDVHPLIGRLISKTFCRDPDHRFPTDDYADSDPSGLREAGRAIDACREELDRVRVEVAAWTTTGMVRSGNEDAAAILHHVRIGGEGADESAALILADGMGGMASGEVAASVAVKAARRVIAGYPPLVTGHDPGGQETRTDLCRPALKTIGFEPSADAEPEPDRDLFAAQAKVEAAIREANHAVLEAAYNGLGEFGMGCTLDVVLIDGPSAVIGHVGDARVYHMHRGTLSQITRDQTYVQYLVDNGQITPEEAQSHARRSELQQAIGGSAEVVPDYYPLRLHAGDWLLVCSDGLTNQLADGTISAVLREAPSAERAARRLVNLANLEGAGDNVTVIAARMG